MSIQSIELGNEVTQVRSSLLVSSAQAQHNEEFYCELHAYYKKTLFINVALCIQIGLLQ